MDFPFEVRLGKKSVPRRRLSNFVVLAQIDGRGVLEILRGIHRLIDDRIE